MRIVCFEARDIFDPYHRGESRWISNWAWILEKAGYEIIRWPIPQPIKTKPFLSSKQKRAWLKRWETKPLVLPAAVEALVEEAKPFLVLNAPWWNNAYLKTQLHIHAKFGAFDKACISHLDCFGDNCFVAAAYKSDFENCDPDLVSKAVCLPTPYSADWDTASEPPQEREGILWAVKEIWHPELMVRSPHIPELALWNLEAVANVAKQEDIKFIMIQPRETGSSLKEAPPEILEVLETIPHKELIAGSLAMDRLLNYCGQARINLPVGGCIGSTVEAVYKECIPLAHRGLVFGGVADELNLTLPYPQGTTREQVIEGLERLWFDQGFYGQMRDAYADQIRPHHESEALLLFQEFIARQQES